MRGRTEKINAVCTLRESAYHGTMQGGSVVTEIQESTQQVFLFYFHGRKQEDTGRRGVESRRGDENVKSLYVNFREGESMWQGCI